MLAKVQLLMTMAQQNAEGTSPGTWEQMIGLVFPILALGLVFYFIIYRPQKKQEKQTKEMRSNIAPGDEITTNGGIIGRIVTMKDDTITIETGADRNKIKIQRWAIHSVDKKGSSRENSPSLPKGGFKVKDIKKD